MTTSATLPNPGAPIVGPDGRLSPVWFGFLLSLYNRTGGTGAGVDVSALQAAIEAQSKEVDSLFMLEGANVSAPLVSALLERVIALEIAIHGVVPATRKTDDILPDPVAVPPKDSATDIYKMVSK